MSTAALGRRHDDGGSQQGDKDVQHQFGHFAMDLFLEKEIYSSSLELFRFVTARTKSNEKRNVNSFNSVI